jgi:ribosomal protein S27E
VNDINCEAKGGILLMVYVVCQTSRCQQTYPIEQFKKDSKNVSCEKCGGILIDSEGRGNLSQNPTVIPVISLEELKERSKVELEEKRKSLKQLKEEIKELEENSY